MMRNLKDECKGCEYREKSLTFCFNECVIPVEVLEETENSRRLKEKEEFNGKM